MTDDTEQFILTDKEQATALAELRLDQLIEFHYDDDQEHFHLTSAGVLAAFDMLRALPPRDRLLALLWFHAVEDVLEAEDG